MERGNISSYLWSLKCRLKVQDVELEVEDESRMKKGVKDISLGVE